MNPAWSVIVFTTAAGAGQGLVVALVCALWAGVGFPSAAQTWALVAALGLLLLGLGASFFHLGHPERAWRAVLMWRTSWLSREVIALPLFVGAVGLWAWGGAALPMWWPALLLALALVLWFCTSMIYACIRFIQEWAHPLTHAGFCAIGLASGFTLAGALASSMSAPASAEWLAPWAMRALSLAWLLRIASLWRNATLKPKSTPQSATGLKANRVVQKHMGMSAGSFNTREFFHGATELALRQVRLLMHGLGFGLPLLLVGYAQASGAHWAWWAAVGVMVPGLLAERWLFFAQARHPQNLYYQRVS